MEVPFLAVVIGILESSPKIEGRPCSHLPDSTWAGGGSKTGVDSTALTMRCDSPDQPADCCSANPHDMLIGVIHHRLPSNSGRRNLPNKTIVTS